MKTYTETEALKLATRACWALLQDGIVSVDMVDDLEVYIAKAVGIAEQTVSEDGAIDMGQQHADQESLSDLGDSSK